MRVELEDVRKEFRGVKALDGVSLDVASGGRVALVGPNGSGKSTLARILMGMLRYRGTARLDGRDPFTERATLADRTAYVPQTQPQLSATVGEITRTVARLRHVRPERVGSVAAELELDLAAVADRPVRSLSGGTKQKLLITLALAAPVSLLIMDEPTASLDTHTREAFLRMFEAHSPGATLLLSSHRLDEVHRLVNRVVVVEAGRVTLDAPVDAPEAVRRISAL